jgi:hypothetical protein
MSVINEQALHAQDVEAIGLPDAQYDEAISNLLDTLSEPISPQQDAWPSLIPFGSDVNLPSMSASLLPDFAGVFAKELAVETETPPGVAVSLILVACALAACRRFKVQVKPRYFEPLNLWAVAALPPGNRKSAVQAAATKPLTDWQSEQSLMIDAEVIRLSSQAKSMNALIAHKRSELAKEKNRQRQIELMDELADLEADVPQIPKPPLLWTSDATPERLGMLLADNDERMAWLSSEGGLFDMLSGRYSGGIPNLDLMLKSHSGDPERVERATRPPVDLHQPLLTIGISPQPSVLEGLAAKPGFRGAACSGGSYTFCPLRCWGIDH